MTAATAPPNAALTALPLAYCLEDRGNGRSICDSFAPWWSRLRVGLPLFTVLLLTFFTEISSRIVMNSYVTTIEY
jgi:hypothetical protein